MAKGKKPRILQAFTRGSFGSEPLKEEVQNLKRAVNELTILSDLAFAMGGSAEPQEIVETLVDRLMRAVSAEQAVVRLLDSEEESDDAMKTNMRLVVTSADQSALQLDDSLLGWMYIHKEPLVINDPKNDDRFRGVSWDDSIHSIMCVPLMVKSQLTGILTIYNKRDPGGFTENDERLLAIIAAQSAHLIENARLYQESLALEQMKEQQKNAFLIQRNLLPSASPEIDGYDIAGESTPALAVGGDYFDYIPRPNGTCAVCLGDVSGKGLPASLLMANLQATLRAHTISDISVDECVRRSNSAISENTNDEQFITLFYGELNSTTHEFAFCNAGHEHPLLFSKDGDPANPGTLESTGIALGIFDGVDYERKSVTLAPDDLVVIYSDGVTDATNEVEEPFGLERLLGAVERYRNGSSKDLIDGVFKEINDFAGKAAQFDDVTLIAVRRKSA